MAVTISVSGDFPVAGVTLNQPQPVLEKPKLQIVVPSRLVRLVHSDDHVVNRQYLTGIGRREGDYDFLLLNQRGGPHLIAEADC